MKENHLMELVRERGGVISVEDAVAVLGRQEYERCYEEALESEEFNGFCQNGDHKVTHVCLSDWAYDWFCDKVDTALESVGALSPRTKDLKVH